MKTNLIEYLVRKLKDFKKDIIQTIQKLKTVFGGKGQINMSDGTPSPSYEQLERENKLVLSYIAVRMLIGLLGFFLPAMLVIGSIIVGSCEEIQPSISNYYHTAMRDVFVGYVCSLSIFLLSYRGYDRSDRIVSALAGAFGLALALLPTNFKIPVLLCNIQCNINHPDFVGTIHLVAAGLFLLSLACFSLFLFTKGETKPTPEKLIRNRIYTGVAYLMFACIGILIIYFALPESLRKILETFKPEFWLETIAIMAFGFSWLVKGQLFFRDQS